MDPSTRAFLEQLQPDENLGQFLSRSVTDTIKSGASILDRQTRFHKTDVVEICGQAGTGKTELLYSIIISHILPNIRDNVDFQGMDKHVIYLDLDYKFDIFRLSNLLQHRIERSIRGSRIGPSNSVEKEIVEIVTQALGKLHVFRSSSSFQFLATLKILAADFIPELYAGGGRLGAILVDNLASYWDMHKELKDQRRSPRVYNEDFKISSALGAALSNLTELQNLCDIPIFVSRRVSGRHDVATQQQNTNRMWRDFTTKSLFIEETNERIGSTYKLTWSKPDIHQQARYRIDARFGFADP